MPDLTSRPKSANRIRAEKAVKEFSESKDTCWRIIYDKWKPDCYEGVEREMNKMVLMLRAVIKNDGLKITVNKRKDAIYMTKEA